MSENEWVPPLVMAAASIFGVAAMVVNLRKARTIEGTPLAKIRSAAQGYVSLSGWTRAGDTALLPAPLTGTPCLWYRYTIERYSRSGRRSHWQIVESGSSEQLFALDDRTGLCHIDPRHADVTPALRKRWQGDDRHPLRPTSGLLAGLFGASYRYTEYRIHPDESLYVLGWFETVHAPGPPQLAQAQMKTLLNEWKKDRDALLARFDRDGNGELDLQEWEQARREAAQQAHHYALQQPLQPPINTVSRPPLRDRPYLIAVQDPQLLARRYRRHALIGLLGGFAIAAVFGLQYF